MSGFALKDCQSVKVTADSVNGLRFLLGHKPKKIEILNLTTGAVAVWNDTLNAGEIFVLSAGGGAGGVGLKTANGITVISDILDANGEGLPAGFDLGALADFNDTTTETLSVTFVY